MNASAERGSSWRRSPWRLAAAFVLGCTAAVSGFVFGMPGHGEFVPLTWLAGGAAIIVAPGWPGFVALLAGATVAATFLDVLDGVFGLVWLILAIVVGAGRPRGPVRLRPPPTASSRLEAGPERSERRPRRRCRARPRPDLYLGCPRLGAKSSVANAGWIVGH